MKIMIKLILANKQICDIFRLSQYFGKVTFFLLFSTKQYALNSFFRIKILFAFS